MSIAIHPSKRSYTSVQGSPLGHLSSWASFPPRLEEMITYQLQTRVLQEATILNQLATSKHELVQQAEVKVERGSINRPLLHLDWQSMQGHPMDEASEQETKTRSAGLPLYFHLAELLDEERQIPELKQLLAEIPILRGNSKDIDARDQDVLTVPARAIFGPLAVALWRLRIWQES